MTVNSPPHAARARRPWRTVAAAGLLAGVTICWAAFPLSTGKSGTRVVLIIGIASAVLSLAQVAVADIRQPDPGVWSLSDRVMDRLLTYVRALPWAEVMIVAVLVLEVLHPARPWHTGLLGIALLGYLLAVHLAETRAAPGVLRPQLPLLAAGAGLTALAVGAAALPGPPAGAVSSIVRLIAALAAVIAGGLIIPTWLQRPR
jgi:hypothetical protein